MTGVVSNLQNNNLKRWKMISDYKIVQIISILLKKCKQTLKVKELLLVDDAKHQQVCKVLETPLNCS